MNSSVARFVALLVVLAALCFADAAHARRDWVGCPVWGVFGAGGFWPSPPENAARGAWKQLGADQCPGAAVVCTGPYENPASYSCIWTYAREIGRAHV